MADWSLPGLGSNYDVLMNNLKDREVDLAKMFDGTGSTNLPVGAVGWSSTNNRFEKWSGTAWGALATTYNINVSTLGGRSASDFILATTRGAVNGVAELDANGLLPSSRLPTGYGKGVANGVAGLDVSGLLTTTLLPVDKWHDYLGSANPTVADAILDRLTSGAVRLPMRGESMRKVRARETGTA